MLRRWEAGDEEVRALWRTMNGWVYAGFDETYKRLGVDFDKIYYESQTYLIGKKEVEEGLVKAFSTAATMARCGSTLLLMVWTKNCCSAPMAHRFI